MPMLNPFLNNDAFTSVNLTKAINILPNNYGRIRELNLLPGRGVPSRTVIIEERYGVLNLLPTMPVGSPGTQGRRDRRKIRSLTIPHIPHDDVILPDEYDGVRAFGTENQLEALSQIVNEHQQTMRNKHAITLEHLRMGAVKGIILDADGSTLYNLYTEFEITPKIINFALTTDTTNIRNKCLEVSRYVEENALGEVFQRVHVLCSQGFFEALISHSKVKEVYQNYEAAADRLGGDPRKGFQFGGLTFEEYLGKATDADGNVRKFIEDDEAHAFPLGTMNSFETLFAPADFLETVNTLGQEIYSKMEPRKFGRGMDLHTQTNPLPICYRPAMLVKLTKTSG